MKYEKDGSGATLIKLDDGTTIARIEVFGGGPCRKSAVSPFKHGDVVRLKSGGPDMTVQEVMTGEVECVWFDGGQRMENDFLNAMLEVS